MSVELNFKTLNTQEPISNDTGGDIEIVPGENEPEPGSVLPEDENLPESSEAIR